MSGNAAGGLQCTRCGRRLSSPVWVSGRPYSRYCAKKVEDEQAAVAAPRPADRTAQLPTTAPSEADDGGTATHPLSHRLTPRRGGELVRRAARTSRYPLLLLTLIGALNLSHQFLLSSVFPLIKEDFGISDAALGLLSSAFLVIGTIGVVPFGILADRYSRTKIIGWGTGVWGIAMMGSGAAGSYPALFGSRTLLGVSDPADHPTSFSLLTDYYPVDERGKVMGIYNAGRIIGLLVLPLGALVAEAYGWRAAFYFFAVPGFLLAILAWRLPEPERGAQDRHYHEFKGEAGSSRFAQQNALRGYLEVLRIPTVLVSYVSTGVGNFFSRGVGIWAPTFLIRYHDMGVASAATVVGLLALCGLGGALAAGYLGDFLVHRGIRAGRLYTAVGAALVGTATLFPAFATQSTPLMFLLLGSGAALLWANDPLLSAVRADVLHPDLRGRGASVDSFTQTLFGAASPLVLGVLSDVATLRAAILALLPLYALSGLLLLFVGPRFLGRDLDGMHAQLEEDDRVARQSLPDPEEAVTTALATPAEQEAEAEGARNALLDLERIDASYGALQVLHGAGLRVPPAGRVALLGPNGAGKTTLLKVASGLLQPTAGRVLYKGVEITGTTPDERVAAGISQVGGGRATFPSMTVWENLWMGAYPFVSTDRELMEQRLDAVLEVFPPLQPLLKRTAGTLSGGEQQMMGLARALMAGPELLMVDELSLGLAPVILEQLLTALDDIAARGTALLVVEQSVNVALSLADDVYLMEKGEVRHMGKDSGLSEYSVLTGVVGADDRGARP